MARFRELVRLNNLLEEDLRTLKETDFMGPTTRAEWNRRRKNSGTLDPTVTSEERKLLKGATNDFTNMEQIQNLPKTEQLRLMKSVFGG